MKNVITVMSGKGGTGCSACAVNLGAVYAQQGRRVLLADLNTGFRALDLILGVQDLALYHYGDVLGGLCRIEDAAVSAPGAEGLSLLAGSPEGFVAETDREALRRLTESCSLLYDLVILDAGTNWAGTGQTCAGISGVTLLVTTPDPAAVRCTEALEDRMIRAGVRNRKYVINRVIPALVYKGLEPEVPETDSRIRCSMAGMILEDENIRASMSAGVPIAAKQDSYISKNFRRIAERLLPAY